MLPDAADGKSVWEEDCWLNRDGRTKREFFRHETTSDGRESASCGWVVVAEAS